MTLLQLRYAIEVAQSGSISAAAENLFIAQPSLSHALKELESEMNVRLFERTSRGVVVTDEGARFLSYARQVVEQADLLESTYGGQTHTRRIFAVSSQHYAFVVNAFVELVREYKQEHYELSLREETTSVIIDDVKTLRSELGILYLCTYNREILMGELKRAGLAVEHLFTVEPHIFVSRTHPLADAACVSLEDLAPYPRLTYDQGLKNSFYFAEEPHATEQVDKSIVVTDRATLFNLLIGLDGYTIATGVLSSDLNGTNIVSVPLDTTETMELVLIRPQGRPLSALGERYVHHLKHYVAQLDAQKSASPNTV